MQRKIPLEKRIKILMEKRIKTLLNKQVSVQLYDGSMVSGRLVHVDKSGHCCLGNLILDSESLIIIRGDAVQFIGVK